MKPAALAAVGLIAALTLVSCSSDATAPISFGRFGPLSGDAGRGSYRDELTVSAP